MKRKSEQDVSENTEAPRSRGLGLFLTQHAGALVVKAMLKGGAAETSGAQRVCVSAG